MIQGDNDLGIKFKRTGSDFEHEVSIQGNRGDLMRLVSNATQVFWRPVPCPFASWLCQRQWPTEGPGGKKRWLRSPTELTALNPTLPDVAETAVRSPKRQGAVSHTLGPLWARPSQWPRKVTWTRKWSSSRRHRWERGAGLRVQRAVGRTAASRTCGGGGRRRCRLGASPANRRAASQPLSCPSEPRSRDRSAGVTMTKAGSKGGNLRDKLDGNELDLSLSDLNEVPVKELVSSPAGPRCFPRDGRWPLPGPPLFPRLSCQVLVLKLGGRSGAQSSGEPTSAPGFRPWMYTCHFGAVPEDEKELLVRP